MVVRIGSNILSQTVQRNLSRATADLSTASERLASGQRINKGADDAAGLAIATSLRTDSRIFGQALRNLNDGLSFANIAESAMESLGTVAERIQELSTQAMSGTFGDAQRQSMQREVTALQAEWNRIVEGTTFNGRNILTGADTRTVLQGGKGVDGTLAVQIGEASLGIQNDITRAGLLTRIDTSFDGSAVNSTAILDSMSISATGRYVTFGSNATNIIPGDTNGAYDTFIKDTATGSIKAVSTDSSGNLGNAYSDLARMSADGRFVAFRSGSTNFVSTNLNGTNGIFLKNLETGAISLISTDSFGNQANDWSQPLGISADGRHVLFHANASNLVSGDTNGTLDVFVKDTLTGITTRVSTDSNGNEANSTSFASAISADGRYVTFRSVASNLVSGDTNLVQDSFIKDTLTGITTRISTDSSGNEGNASSTPTAISADGRFVAFLSTASNLVSGDTNGFNDAFIKDTLTGITTRVSTDSFGHEGNSSSAPTGISADGRYVLFDSSASNLVSGDTNGFQDSFIKDTLTGVTTRINNDGSGIESSFQTSRAFSADGRYVGFLTVSAPGVHLRDLSRAGVQTMSGMVVSNRASAGVTLDLIQKYRDELLQYRANIGATTSRISTFMNTVSAANINYKAAESRISDADVASEAANTVRNTILQQTASSLLGQANQAPQIALRLLQNA